MSIKSKNIFVISIVTSVCAVGVLLFFFYEIRSQGIRLEEQVAILTESSTKEAAFVQLKRLAQETESKRTLLASSFFKTEGDSVTFLSEIEALASSLGLSLKTEGLDKITDEETKQEFIKMTFVYEGQKAIVFSFSQLMEVTPYHAKVESLSLRKLSDNNWEGELTILITISSL